MQQVSLKHRGLDFLYLPTVPQRTSVPQENGAEAGCRYPVQCQHPRPKGDAGARAGHRQRSKPYGDLIMWEALTSGAASFGRLLLVSLLPNGLLAFAIWAFLRAGSFSGQSNWKAVVSSILHANIAMLFLFASVVVLLAVILQPFQVAMVRLLEGYWPGWTVTSRLASLFIGHHHRRINDSEKNIRGENGLYDDATAPLDRRVHVRRDYLTKSAAQARAERILARYPYIGDYELLPTSLGNALRAGETTAGERYGLDTLSSWLRMYPNLSVQLKASADSARDALDACVNLCVSFFLLAILSAVAAYHNVGALWIPILALLMMVATYAGAISTTVSYNEILRSAYDLHRFDMVKALHYKLPSAEDDEYELFQELSRLFQALGQYRSMSGIRGTGIAHDIVTSPYDHDISKTASQDQGG